MEPCLKVITIDLSERNFSTHNGYWLLPHMVALLTLQCKECRGGGFDVACEPTPDPQQSSGRRKGGNTKAEFQSQQKTCTECGGECRSGSRFCATHKRAYECVYREAMSPAGQSNGSRASFEAIFGGDEDRRRNMPPQPSLMIQVLTDFVAAFPEGKAKKTNKRGHVNWSRYIHTKGHAKRRQLKRTACHVEQHHEYTLP